MVPEDWSTAQACILANRLQVSELPEDCMVQVEIIHDDGMTEVVWRDGDLVIG